MSRRMPCPTPTHPCDAALLLVCLAALTVAVPAHAGIGDLIKKAKDKATQAVQPKKEATPPSDAEEEKLVFGDVIVELTTDRVEHFLAGCEAGKKAEAGRQAVAEKLTRTQDERAKLFDKSESAIRAVRNQRDDVNVCLQDGYKEAANQRMMEYQQKALTDPVIREKFTRAAQKHNEAAARGDSSAIQSLQQTLMAEMLPTREDSLKVQQKCGPMPPPLPAEARLEALDKDIAAVGSDLRQMDEKAVTVQAEASGLDAQQFAMALERIKTYLEHRKSNSSRSRASKSSGSSASGSSGSSASSGSAAVQAQPGYTAAEVEALEKYLEKLKAATAG
jgi:hypothetical protein